MKIFDKVVMQKQTSNIFSVQHTEFPTENLNTIILLHWHYLQKKLIASNTYVSVIGNVKYPIIAVMQVDAEPG